MLNPDQTIHWHNAPMAEAAVPFRTGGGLRLGRPWKWALMHGTDSASRVLLAFDGRKQEHRIWQFQDKGDDPSLLLRVEYHGHAPGWHAHSGGRETSALTAPRQEVTASRFPLLENDRLWTESPNDRIRALFPFETMRGTHFSEISEILKDLSDDAVLHAVPFGAGIGLPAGTAHGDSLGFYIAQLGRRTPLFRLEDDGTTIPVLQASGCLAFSEQLDPHHIFSEGRARDFYFGPDNRALFTPFFPLDELLDRARLFVSILKALWGHLDGDSSAAGTTTSLKTAAASASYS